MQPPQQQPRHPKKKPNRAVLIVLSIVLGVLVLCVTGAVIIGLTAGNDGNQPAVQPTPGQASMLAEQGIPPKPDTATWAAYIAALKAIDPDIVHGKDDQAVDRGRNQCSSVKNTPTDQAKLIELTTRRFTSPTHPEGFGAEKSTRILAVIRQYICPSY